MIKTLAFVSYLVFTLMLFNRINLDGVNFALYIMALVSAAVYMKKSWEAE